MNVLRRSEALPRPRRSLTIAGALLTILVGVASAQTVAPADHLSTASTATTAPANSAKPAAKPRHHWYQFGVASWYGRFFQGKTTASGQPYDENAMTCAHRTLPLGSVLRVTNLRNHKSVVVRVNDRGPMPESRVIDLSYAAAYTLGFSERGIAPVKVELLSAPTTEVARLDQPDEPAASR
ncbi:MAG TPA: septal ring lytic transglycosylase RlpA family protein [Acidobacteriaceae bacterium]|nr:septal ring lytic transglycosylase RlpA family protein [Acidobacteriaceae bacterium]